MTCCPPFSPWILPADAPVFEGRFRDHNEDVGASDVQSLVQVLCDGSNRVLLLLFGAAGKDRQLNDHEVSAFEGWDLEIFLTAWSLSLT